MTDELYRSFKISLNRITGPDVISNFKSKHLVDYIDISREFEVKKRTTINTTRSVTIRLSAELLCLCQDLREKNLKTLILQSKYEGKVVAFPDKLRIDADVFNEFFEPTVRKIVSHVENILTESSVDGCAAILMVGGFSESSVLQRNVKSTFKHLKVIVPDDAGLAVLKGAVIFGHKPTIITERVCKFTYGEAISHIYKESCTHAKGRVETDKNGDLRCYDIFLTHVKEGQSVKVNEEQAEFIASPVNDDQTCITTSVYASSSTNPQLTSRWMQTHWNFCSAYF
jgi:molecular chaperone DnaK (HSP70)